MSFSRREPTKTADTPVTKAIAVTMGRRLYYVHSVFRLGLS